MNDQTIYTFCATLFLISALYSCVGQAGASGYIAAMALFNFAPESIKPTALVLNVLVAAVVSVRFFRAGHFSKRLLLPFAVSSVPAAFVGGFIILPPVVFNRLLGGVLFVAAVPFFFRRDCESAEVSSPSVPVALFAGASIGFLSGLTGVGGGVLITPLMLYCHWARPRVAAAVSAVFILINSIAALIGHIGAVGKLPVGLALFALAAVLGGAVGSQLGSLHLSSRAIFRILGSVLLVASAKLLFASA